MSTLDRKLRQFGFKSYKDYVKSSIFKNFKLSYSQSNLPQYCIACHYSRFILHHIRFTSLTKEWFYDVIPLCYACHNKLHRFNRKNPHLASKPEVAFQEIYGWAESEALSTFAYWINAREKFVKEEDKIPEKPRDRYYRISRDLNNFRQYVKDGYSIQDLAKMYKVNTKYVKAYMRKYPEYFE